MPIQQRRTGSSMSALATQRKAREAGSGVSNWYRFKFNVYFSTVLFASKFIFCDVPVSIVPFRNHYLIPAGFSKAMHLPCLCNAVYLSRLWPGWELFVPLHSPPFFQPFSCMRMISPFQTLTILCQLGEGLPALLQLVNIRNITAMHNSCMNTCFV